jgi:hypothetical protein
MFLCKPFGPSELTAFLVRVTAADVGIDPHLEGRMAELARRWGLGPREADILAWLVAGRSRRAYLEKMGITEVSWRAAVGRLLASAGHARTNDLVTAVLREHARALSRAREACD